MKKVEPYKYRLKFVKVNDHFSNYVTQAFVLVSSTKKKNSYI